MFSSSLQSVCTCRNRAAQTCSSNSRQKARSFGATRAILRRLLGWRRKGCWRTNRFFGEGASQSRMKFAPTCYCVGRLRVRVAVRAARRRLFFHRLGTFVDLHNLRVRHEELFASGSSAFYFW